MFRSGKQGHKPHPADAAAAAAAAISKPLQTAGGSVSLPSSPVAKAKPASISRQGSQQFGQTTPRRQSSLAPLLFSPVRQPSAAVALPPISQPSSTGTISKQSSIANAAAPLHTRDSEASLALAAAFTRAAQRANSGIDSAAMSSSPVLAVNADMSATDQAIDLPSSLDVPLLAATSLSTTDAKVEVAKGTNTDFDASQTQQKTAVKADGATYKIPAPALEAASAPVTASTDTLMPVATVPIGDALPTAVPALQTDETAELSPDSNNSSPDLVAQAAQQQKSTVNMVAADYAKMMGEQDEQKQASAAAQAGVTDSHSETTIKPDVFQLASMEAGSTIPSQDGLWEDGSLIPAKLPPAPNQPSSKRAGSALFQKLAGEYPTEVLIRCSDKSRGLLVYQTPEDKHCMITSFHRYLILQLYLASHATT